MSSMKNDAKYHYICLLDIHPLVGYLIKSFHNFYCVIFLFPCETISLFWVPVPYQVYILQIFAPSQFLASVFLAVSSKEKFFNFEVKFILCYLLLHVSYLIIFLLKFVLLYRLYFQMQKCNQFGVNAYSLCFLFKDDLNSVMSLATRTVTNIVWILHQYQMKNILRQDLSSEDLFPDSTLISS